MTSQDSAESVTLRLPAVTQPKTTAVIGRESLGRELVVSRRGARQGCGCGSLAQRAFEKRGTYLCTPHA